MVQPPFTQTLKRSSVDATSLFNEKNVFLSRDGKSPGLRRRSLESLLPQRRKKSWGDIAKTLKNTDVLLSAGAKKTRFADHALMGMDKVANYQNQGIPRENLEKTQAVADRTETIIAYRPVERICRTLIEEGAESKGLNIKGKSSNWGPMAGFIPYNQKFSKVASIKDPDAREAAIEKYNTKNEASVRDGHATIEHLSLSQRRMDELTDMGLLRGFQKIPPAEGYNQAFTLSAPPKGTEDQTFEAHLNPEGKWDIFSGSGDTREKLMIIPKTADFDLLFTFSPYEKIDLAGDDKMHDFDADLGIYSDRDKSLIDTLNNEFDRGPGKNMVHHGADVSNPVTDMDANLPATIVIPKNLMPKMGIYTESPVMIKSFEELVKFFRTMRDGRNKNRVQPTMGVYKKGSQREL